MIGRALPSQMARIERLCPKGWGRMVLLAVARYNAGDAPGHEQAMSVLLRMLADDLGGTPEVARAIQRAVEPSPGPAGAALN